MTRRISLFAGVILGTSFLVLLHPSPAHSQVTLKDIQNENVSCTRHNLSAIQDLTKCPPVGPKGAFPDIRALQGEQPTDPFRRVFTDATTEICVFCHTPHGANPEGVEIRAPIWNRSLSTENYTLYDQAWSFSFRGEINPGAPTGYSRLCLACHDGTIALGRLLNVPGTGPAGTGSAPFLSPPFEMTYPDTAQAPSFPSGGIPLGTGPGQKPELTGDTRRLGTDLTNDHPLSFVFDSILATTVDKELVDPGPPLHPPQNVRDLTPISPMRRYPGQDMTTFDSVQCTSCHNPHTVQYPKFLRANWLNLDRNSTDPDQKLICLFCHDKPGFKDSSHEISPLVHATYPQKADPLFGPMKNPGYDFNGTNSVAEYSCRNCHDPHAAQGAKRLHREGVDEPNGMDATELTCYLCHSPRNGGIRLPGGVLPSPLFIGSGLAAGTNAAPDILTQFARDSEAQAIPGMSNAQILVIPPDFTSGPQIGPGGLFSLTQSALTGAAMNLRLGAGHHPVFTSQPAEGVELFGSQSPPNRGGAGVSIPRTDTVHVECVDCHNPHRVRRTNRFNGMNGIDIDGFQVGTYFPRSGSAHPNAPAILSGPDPANTTSETLVYEVCFRCHGNTFNNHVPQVIVPAQGFVGHIVNARGNNPNSTGSSPIAQESLVGGSNKRLEFNPDRNSGASSLIYTDNGLPFGGSGSETNTAFHPVFQRGRNQSGVLNNFTLNGQLLGDLSRESTIQCTDCHNTDIFGTYTLLSVSGVDTVNSDGNALRSDFAGAITGDNTLGDPFRRITDLLSNISPAVLADPAKPQGPHGSIWRRILRANYDTTLGDDARRPDGTRGGEPLPAGGYKRENFALCFQCHREEAFTTKQWDTLSDRLTNFARGNPSLGQKVINLHWLHVVGNPAGAGANGTNARCHECHYNVHSNIESGNTLYVSLSKFVTAPDGLSAKGHDKSTHLINFQPKIKGSGQDAGLPAPAWGYGPDVTLSGSGDCFLGCSGLALGASPVKIGATFEGPGCNLRCHGFTMYVHYNEHCASGGIKDEPAAPCPSFPSP